MRSFRAPGRVNLIGEHTDYNQGLVMPAAIHLATYVTAEAREDRNLVVDSESFSERREFSLDDSGARARGDWGDYVVGVARILEAHGFPLRGANLGICSEVPMGSGLSSSAALEVAVALALLTISDIAIPAPDLARLCQRAENEFVGMNCGIMDQFTSCCGKENHALLLDCRTLEYRPIPLPADARLIVCDTKVRHRLTSGDYNQRRAECEAGVRELARIDPMIRSLRDATVETLKSAQLPPVLFKRCRHVITEIARVTHAASAFEAGDLQSVGRLMAESHRSLRDDYQVSCPELDLMVELARSLPGVYGSRMTGGGFGGCTVNLVEAEHADEFTGAIAEGYRAKTGIEPSVWICRAVDGASEIMT